MPRPTSHSASAGGRSPLHPHGRPLSTCSRRASPSGPKHPPERLLHLSGTGAADQYCWGENDALQHRAGGPVDESAASRSGPCRPGGPGRRRRPARPRAPARGGAGAPPARSGRDGGAGSSARRRWMVRAEGRSSKPRRGSQQRRNGAPAGVLGAEVEDGLPERLGDGRGAAAVGVVGGAIDLAGTQQVADGAHGTARGRGRSAEEVDLAGRGGGWPDGRAGGGSWHGVGSGGHRTTLLNLTRPPAGGESTGRRPCGKTFCRVPRQNLMSRNRDPAPTAEQSPEPVHDGRW